MELYLKNLMKKFGKMFVNEINSFISRRYNIKKYDVPLLEDSVVKFNIFMKKKTKVYIAFSSFSFYFGHQLSSIEGGMVNTDDEELYHWFIEDKAIASYRQIASFKL